MPLDVSDLGLVDLMVEQRLELSAPPRRRRHLLCRLSSTHDNVVHERRDARAIDRPVRLVALDRLQRRGIVESGAHVLASCDERHLIEREGEVGDATLVVSALLYALSFLHVPAEQPSAVSACDDPLVQGAPQRAVRPRHAEVHGNFLDGLVGVRLRVEDVHDRGVVAPRVRQHRHPLVAKRQADAAHTRLGFQLPQHLPCFHIPNPRRLVH
mmetsp:Transcript_31299/g.73781  ORF Transcript_31299/g.73781 Transcript_31299/m.73781 type:complete len:212 (-) Transcript_31299:268-903(-)